MLNATTVELDREMLVIRSGFELKEVCREIPKGIWDPYRRAWVAPATPDGAFVISQLFGPSAQFLNGAESLLDQGKVQREARRRKEQDIDPEPIPVTKTTPWRHQAQAYHFAKSLQGCLLAIGMGAGKSKICTDLICNLDIKRILICAPTSVVPVWPRQFQIHAGSPVRVVNLDEAKSVKQRRLLAEKSLNDYQGEKLALILGYGGISCPGKSGQDFRDWLLAHMWDLVISDESHVLKGPGTTRSRFFANVRSRARRRLALTGTPMPSSPLDIYGQMRFLDPSLFGTSFTRFKARYAITQPLHGGPPGATQVVGFRLQDEMAEIMSRITFEARTDDVLDLPEATHVERFVNLSPEEWRVYRQLEKNFIAEVKSGLITAANAMVKILRLAQVTGGFARDEHDVTHRIGSAKENELAEVLEGIGHEPVVVFCRFHEDLDAARRVGEEQGREVRELSGRANDIAKTGGIWTDGDLLVTQIQAGGLGVDLTRARYACYFSLGYSLGEYEQSLARLRRPGQTRNVTYIHLIARNTVDVTIYEAIQKKKNAVQTVLDQLR